MAKILGILTAVVLVASVLIGIKNNDRFAQEIEAKDIALKELKISQKEFLTQQGILNALPIEIAQVESDTVAALAEEEQLKLDNETLKAAIETKKQKIASNTQDLEAARAKLEQAGDINELVSKIKALTTQSTELDQIVLGKEELLTTKTDENTKLETHLARLKSESEIMNRGNSLPSLKTRIRSIYPSWGFVTLASGFKSGVIGGSPLDVVRDNQVIAKLLVTAVESNSASASIVPNSILEDVTLRVGDQVVPGSGDSKSNKDN